MKLVAAAALAAALLALAALAGVGRPEAARGEAPPPPKNVVTVTGTGSVETVPDRAELSLGVRTHARTARDAAERNAERMRRVLDALRDVGLDGKDIQTQEISLSPRFERGRGIVGYTAANTVSAGSEIDELAAALDAALGAGATQTYGFTLTRSDRDDLYRDALADAVADARAKAEALAEAGGFDVAEVVQVEESHVDGVMRSTYGDAALEAQAAAPVEPGREEVRASVAVSFAIR